MDGRDLTAASDVPVDRTFTIGPVTDSEDLDATGRLFGNYALALGIDLTFQDFSKELANLPGKYAPPGGALLLARYRETNDAIGCVALRPLTGGICEMKRLYVDPKLRGSGLGKKLCIAITKEARRLGYSKMRLDTLATMKAAIKLYVSVGFREISAYYHNPIEGTKYLELDLT